MFLEQNVGHLKALFFGVWEDRKMRIQILNMLKGKKTKTKKPQGFLHYRHILYHLGHQGSP